MTERAVAAANTVLGVTRHNLRLRVGWKRGDDTAIPVIIVDGDGLSAAHIVFVPWGTRMVIVNADKLESLMQYFVSTHDLAQQIALHDVLAFALLHEAGHIHFNDKGSFMPAGSLAEVDMVTLAISKQGDAANAVFDRNPELRADLFAMDSIETASRSSDDAIWMTGANLSFVISDITWNQTLMRDPNFWGGNRPLVSGPAVPYGHTDLEFRLRVAHVIRNASSTSITMDYALGAIFLDRSSDPRPEPYWTRWPLKLDNGRP